MKEFLIWKRNRLQLWSSFPYLATKWTKIISPDASHANFVLEQYTCSLCCWREPVMTEELSTIHPAWQQSSYLCIESISTNRNEAGDWTLVGAGEEEDGFTDSGRHCAWIESLLSAPGADVVNPLWIPHQQGADHRLSPKFPKLNRGLNYVHASMGWMETILEGRCYIRTSMNFAALLSSLSQINRRHWFMSLVSTSCGPVKELMERYRCEWKSNCVVWVNLDHIKGKFRYQAFRAWVVGHCLQSIGREFI